MPTLLLIDHDAFFASIYAQTFEREGFSVQTVLNGEDGIRAASARPDVIMLDLALPRMSGFSMLEALKSDAATSDIPVIIFTHFCQRQDIDRCLALGADAYLMKAHAQPHEVVGRVKRLVRYS